MPTRGLFSQLFLSHLLVTMVVLGAIGWYSLGSIGQFYEDTLAKDLEARARILEYELLPQFQTLAPEDLDTRCKTVGKRTETRITVIAPDGKVLGDTEANPAAMDNHARRPEVLEAAAKGLGTSVRYSATLQKRMMYLAIPLRKNRKMLGTLRLAVPVTGIEDVLWTVRRKILVASLVIALGAVGLGWVLTRRISQPLETMRVGAKRFAGGDLEYQLPVPKLEEARQLAEALNLMAAQLRERIDTLQEQQRNQEALLSSMVEGVIAVDSEERILIMNPTAARLFQVDVKEIIGQSLPEVIRNVSLQRIASQVLEGNTPIEGEIRLLEPADKVLQVHSVPLRSAQGQKRIGALVVLNDLTPLRRLEVVRSDFVANVSHELKTPITLIKGFVETLRDGALEDVESVERFLDIIGREADRLNSIIEDLLSLSRIEEDSRTRRISVEESRLKEVLEAAVKACEAKAKEKNTEIRVDCDDNVNVTANPRLLEQAVVNLIDNAIKYGDSGNVVRVEVRAIDSTISIQVSDKGCGIDRRHLDRLFERFYRIDKARSRKLGGTGLGLAIVKHIAQAHGGEVVVESEPGVGSTFSIQLPQRG